MRILIVGGGGREHALAWALSRSAAAPELFIAPGNPGTAALGRNVPIDAADVGALRDFAIENAIDLTIVGPEQPLVLGLVDRFEEAGLAVVGPTAAAARLEGSKAFSKAFMERHGIPTAAHRTFTADAYDEALAYLRAGGAPVVLKASGLAAGKGAVVCMTMEEAERTMDELLRQRVFGAACDEVVVESFMEGEEASVFVLTDGRDYVLLAPAQDHKRVGEHDTGPNTGGMGAYAPAPVVTPAVLEEVRRTIIEPTLAGMAAEGAPYRGFLYCGLMMTAEGPKVVEFNCRLGDPEAQVVLPLLETDPVELFAAAAEQRLGSVTLRQRRGAAACVVVASEGYPGAYRKGDVIEGLEAAAAVEGVVVFHAGTKQADDGRVHTAGGRVLGVTGVGGDLADALQRAYEAIGRIHFDGMHYRRDIGRRGLAAREALGDSTVGRG